MSDGRSIATGERFQCVKARLTFVAIDGAGQPREVPPLELVTEDDQTTNPGAVLAFSKLASQPDLVAFLGSIRSTQNHAMAPDIMAKPTTQPNHF